MASFLHFLCMLLPLTVSSTKPRCPTRCGNVEITYPFGIGSNCSMDPSFNIHCNDSTPYLSNGNRSQVINISESQVRVRFPYLEKICYDMPNTTEDEKNLRERSDINIDLSLTPYTLSGDNWITVLGCDDFVAINGTTSQFFAGCTSLCGADVQEVGNGSCPQNGRGSLTGNGCCRSPIPKGTTHLGFRFSDMHGHTGRNTRLFPCSYAFVGENMSESRFSYSLRGLKNSTEFQNDNPRATSTPLVLEWRIGRQNCIQAKRNSSAFACRKNSHCDDFGAENEGYICRCVNGFEGNPYLSEGCRDTNECGPDSPPVCVSHCINTVGGYKCLCPKGHRGDGRKNGTGCIPQPPSKLINASIGMGSGMGFMLLLSICCWLHRVFRQRKDKSRKDKFFKRNGGLLLQQQTNEGGLGKTKLFTAKELEKATDQFNENRILGQGGHGTVYKGILSEGKIVAIKKAKLVDEAQLEQFINEMVILSQINHKNIVKLLGCCLETEVPLLVYEFVPNGTLFSLIHDQSTEFPFLWNMRLKIATDIACALSYLHSASSIPIYHRDIKSSNILLDERYIIKVSDFGSSRLVAVDQTHLTTQVTGTFGYVDPEYFQSSQFTEKSDVYSFGVVLVELLTGNKPISFDKTQEERSLAMHFLVCMEESSLDKILDAQVLRQGRKEDVIAVARLAQKCLNLKGRLRPTMKEVAAELENIRKSQMHSIVEDESQYAARLHEPKLMMLSSFDYSWTTSVDNIGCSSAVCSPRPLMDKP